MTLPLYKWKLKYEDGKVFSSLNGYPDESPTHGVFLCGQPGVDGQDVLASRDYLLHLRSTNLWKEVDIAGLFDHLTFRCRDIDAFRITRQLDRSKTFRDEYQTFCDEIRGRK